MTRQVLVIDFEPRSLETTASLLQSHGFEVIKVSTLAEVDALMEQMGSVPKLVVLEPMLPGLDGFKLCRALKKNARTEEPTRVLIGSRIFQGARYRSMAREAGADLFYKKPAENDLLIETLTRLAAAMSASLPGSSTGGNRRAAGVSGSVPAAGSESVFDALSGMDVDQALSRAMDSGPIKQESAVTGQPTATQIPIQATSSEEPEEDPLSIGDTFAVPQQPRKTPTAALPEAAAAPAQPLAVELVLPQQEEPPAPVAPATPSTPAAQPPAPASPTAASPTGASPTGASPTGAPPAPAPSPEGGPAEYEMTGEQVLDDILAKALTGAAPSEALAPQECDSDQAIDEIFSGSVAAPSDPPVPPTVPAGLQGMDAGTADLLSSLEELEDSVPQVSDEEALSSSIFPTGEAPLEIETSIPLKPPPPSAAEESLSALFEGPASGTIDSEQLLSEIVPAIAPEKVAEIGALASDAKEPPAEKPAAPSKSVPWLYIGLAAVVLMACGLGLWMMRDKLTTGPAEGADAALEASQLPAGEEDPLALAGGLASQTGMAGAQDPSANPLGTDPLAAAGEVEAEPVPPEPTAEEIEQQRLAEEQARQARAAQDRRRRQAAAASQAMAAAVNQAETLGSETEDAVLDLTPPVTDSFEPVFEDEVLVGEVANAPALAPQIAGINGVSVPQPIPSTQVAATYPTSARRLGVEGKVVLQAVVMRDGSVSEIKVLAEPPGNHGFGNAAIDALTQWRYQPAQRDGHPVDAFVTVTMRFSR